VPPSRCDSFPQGAHRQLPLPLLESRFIPQEMKHLFFLSARFFFFNGFPSFWRMAFPSLFILYRTWTENSPSRRDIDLFSSFFDPLNPFPRLSFLSQSARGSFARAAGAPPLKQIRAGSSLPFLGGFLSCHEYFSEGGLSCWDPSPLPS